jgi:hypothetical protein
MGTMLPVRRLALLLALLTAGCGGGSDGDAVAPTTTAAPTPTGVVTVTVPDTADPAEEASGEPTFEVTLRGQSHEATAGAAWAYTVTARKGAQPAGGTAKMRVFLDGELIDTLGWFPFDGRLTRTHRWQKALRGKEVVFQAEVEGEGGTQRANWPVSIS